MLLFVVAPAVTGFEATFVCLCSGRLRRGGRGCGCDGREARLVAAEGLLLVLVLVLVLRRLVLLVLLKLSNVWLFLVRSDAGSGCVVIRTRVWGVLQMLRIRLLLRL